MSIPKRIKSMMEKRNVVAADRTPVHEFKDINGDWDKVAVAMFDLSDVDEAPHVKNVDKPAVDKDGRDGRDHFT